MENIKLRKLITKGPNFREPRTPNFMIAFEKIKSAINQCNDNLSNKTSHAKQVISSWKKIVFEKVKLKIDILNERINLLRRRRYCKILLS